MPEGDTIYRAAAALHRALAGHAVIRFDTGLAHLARVHDDTPVTGRTVERCESRGKHLLICLSGDLVLRTHMRMSGSWHLYRPGERWRRSPRAMRVRLDTDAWVAVAFDVPDAEFLAARDLSRSRALRSLGPDLLSPAVDRAEALARLAAAGPRPIGEVLLDQRVVAGIGNVFRNEVLFVCGVHPDRPTSSLPSEALTALIDTAIRLMRANTGPGATSDIVTYRGLRRTTSRTAGEDRLWVYGRAGKKCRTCGAAIRAEKRGLDARATYWCGGCQRIS